MELFEQVKRDIDNKVLISQQTWHAVLDAAIEQRHTAASRQILVTALRSVLAEVTPGVRPTSSDSYLPPSVVAHIHAAIAAEGAA